MENTRYTKDHEWIRLDGEVATVGITSYAQSQLGDVVFVELPQVGTANPIDLLPLVYVRLSVKSMVVPQASALANAGEGSATMWRKVPPSAASKTLVILLVSISSNSSPGLNGCPSCLSQPRTLPSVIVRPHFGIVIGVIALIDRQP